MNTPKLNNMLLNAVGRGGGLPVGTPSTTPAVDFSQLLGERREQHVANITPRQPVGVERRSDAPPSGRAPVADVGDRQDSRARNAAPSQESARGERGASAQGADAPREASSGRNAAQANTNKRESGATDTGNRASAATSQASAQGSSLQAERPVSEAEPGAQDASASVAPQATVMTQAQAQQAAVEMGLPLAAAVQAAVQTLADTPAAGASAASAHQPGTPAVPQAITAHPEAVAAAPGTALPDTLAARAHDMNGPSLTAGAVSTGGTPPPPQQAGQLNTPAQRSLTRALADQTVALAAHAPAANAAGPVVTPDLHTPAPAAAQQGAGQTLAAQPMPVNVAGTAAALSLQDFTAMVEAARATSGTPLQGAAPASGAPVALTPTGGFPGIPMAGMMPGQAPLAGMPVAGSIATPMASPQWPTELGRQFISNAKAGNGLGQVAELRLDPPELGPLRITINLNDNVAHAVFSSPHASVRQTVENALPQLQQMLEQAGISLGQANVNDQQSGQAAHDGSGASGRSTGNPLNAAGEHDAEAGAMIAQPQRPTDPNALVDTFA